MLAVDIKNGDYSYCEAMLLAAICLTGTVSFLKTSESVSFHWIDTD